MAGEQNLPNGAKLGNTTEIADATKIAVFGDADGSGLRLIGCIEKSSLAGIPLSGTVEGSPVTGDIEFENPFVNGQKRIFTQANNLLKEIIFPDDGSITFSLTDTDDDSFISMSLDLSGMYMGFPLGSQGIIGYSFFNKLNDPNAYPQLGDIAVSNSTAVPLSLSDLNTAYPTQPTGFKVICPEIDIIYVKSSLTTWKNLNTNQSIVNNSYSTTEQLTGGTWIDGKPIYRITIEGNTPDNIDISLFKIESVVKKEMMIIGDDAILNASDLSYSYYQDGDFKTIFCYSVVNLGDDLLNIKNYQVIYDISDGTVLSQVDFIIPFTVILEYTKTTDKLP